MEQPEVILDSDAAATAPEPEAQEPEIEIEDALLDEEQAPDEDELEDELDGVKVRGKKEAIEKLRNERLMQSDYTRKMQANKAAVEAERQAVAQQRQQVEQASKLYQAHLNVVADLVATDKQIAAFKQVDWNALIDADPVQAQKLDRQYKTLLENKQQGMQQLSALQQQHALDEQRRAAEMSDAEAKRIEQAAEVLRREVPNWSAKRDQELREYAVKQGLPGDHLRSLVSAVPQIGKVLHKAELYDRLIAKQTASKAPEVQEAPVTRITSTRTAANKDPSKMTDSEFAAWRRRQIAQRR